MELQEKFLNKFIENIFLHYKDKSEKMKFESDPYQNRVRVIRPISPPMPVMKPLPNINNPIQIRPQFQNLQPSISNVPIKQTVQQPTINGLTKIQQFLENPFIRGIECTGPGRPLVLNKQGVIQTTNIILSNEEINQYIKEISQKTRIPLLPGLFKAIFGNHIITAVISEFVGSRFIIERRY